MSKVFAVILAGGQGTRFWPVSRKVKPKQFLPLVGKESLIRATADRIEPLVGRDGLIVVTSRGLERLVHDHLPTAQILIEPLGRNTAASIGLAAIHSMKHDPDAINIILPADHAVQNVENQIRSLRDAVDALSKNDTLVTIGVEPSYPHTGYGYIHTAEKISGNTYKVGRFFEKPNYERAKAYCESGDYYWNSGMFVWRAETILRALKEFMPNLYQGLREIDPAIGTKKEQSVTQEVFDRLESVSIDFGVLEHAKGCIMIKAYPYGWNDVGSWDAWAEQFSPDENGNVAEANTVLIDSKKCIVHSEGPANSRLVALLGVEDLVIIDSGDALLVCARDRVQDVKQVVEQLQKGKREDLT
ncbi:MAG: mannose-1-phosphate guanylyltransferase [Proteobacteria bacterium]|nr:MAG: mannose-1-phosphate guanylyltransferase [Pseudomonadota bacterium]